VIRAPAGLYNLPIRTTKTLNYNASMLPFEHWHMGRQWVAKMIAKTMSVNANLRGDGNKLEPWGFKHPRTALLVPFWHGTLADKFLYIHVLRDGKDIVEGDNQKVFNDHCSPLLPLSSTWLTRTRRLVLWQALRLGIDQAAARVLGRPQSRRFQLRAAKLNEGQPVLAGAH